MGCNGSKSVTVLQIEDAAATPDTTVGDDVRPMSAEVIEEKPVLDVDSSTRPVTPQPVPPSMAFDVPLDDGSDSASIVKRHPPRRLQRLEEQQQMTAAVSLQDLQDKQQEAENRRLQFLQMRAQSAKRKFALRNNSSAPNSAHNTATDIEEIPTI